MQITLYGATGRAGSRILQELTARGHQVTAVTRDAQPPASSAVTWKTDDLSSVDQIASTIAGSDAVISAYAPPPDHTDALICVCERLAQAVAQTSGQPRLLVVGGAGVLQVAPGLTLLDSGKLPPAWVPIARSHSQALAALRNTAIDWTYLSPAAFFDPGERTGNYRISADTLLVDSVGESRISMEDYAIAMADEIEHPAHRRASFAVAW